MTYRACASKVVAVTLSVFVFSVVMSMMASQIEAGAIYSDANDGFTEARDTGGPWPVVHGDTFGNFRANVGEWFGPGITTAVLPFQIPDLGTVSNPFTSASLGLRVFQLGNATVSNADLYGVRVDSDPAILASDHYSGASPDPTATLVQAGFLTPASSSDDSLPGPNNFSSPAGETALTSYLNTAYAGGANVGNFVFLRLSYAKDGFADGWDAYNFTVREAGGGEPDYPVINFTAVPEPTSMILLGLGAMMISSVRRQG